MEDLGAYCRHYDIYKDFGSLEVKLLTFTNHSLIRNLIFKLESPAIHQLGISAAIDFCGSSWVLSLQRKMIQTGLFKHDLSNLPCDLDFLKDLRS